MELITVYSANLCSYFFTLNGQVLKLKEQIWYQLFVPWDKEKPRGKLILIHW
jgi:hypothetical protein